jgi:uncharacterized membrane protein YfcA
LQSIATFAPVEMLGYLVAVGIGVSLGLIGGGGSILTLPMLVYLFNIDPVMATAYSLFIVGVTSLIGVFPKYQIGEVHLKSALVFGLPSILAVFITRLYLLPSIPSVIFQWNGFEVTKSLFLLLLFAVLMVFASIAMSIVGILTGLVGAGGGFIIIPALVLFSQLSMKQAVGTSLLIIAAKSLVGILGDIGSMPFEWNLLLSITALSILGMILGIWISKRIDGDRLKSGFGWLVLGMGVLILLKELFFNPSIGH